VGDVVGFKSDVEQYGKVIKIQGQVLTLEPVGCEGFQGAYISGQESTTQQADRCWKD
jgi:hypothetical protein